MYKRQRTAKVLSIFTLIIVLLTSFPFVTVNSSAASLDQNQANMVARCNYMYNATWVCEKTISSWKNQSYFNKGSTYRIPYAWPVTTGKWVGDTSYGISVSAFLESTKNASSDFYTKQSYCSSNSGSYAPYYGNDCSTFVTYCWGLSKRVTTSSLPNSATLIGNVTSTNVNSSLKIGDALNYAGSHVVFVSNITYSGNEISAIEITEQTPPQLKRTNHTVSSLVSKYGAKYKIYRYSGTVSAPPSGAGMANGNNPDNYTAPSSALTTGAKGSGVCWIQSVLSQLGYTITVDGTYGNATATQVAYFQKDYALTVSGIADTDTIIKLKTLWANKNGYYTTTASSLNMRSGDSTSYGVITTIPQDSQVAVVGFNSAGTWANIIYNNTEGWVSASYLSFVRKFNYSVNFNTNISVTMPSVAFKHDRAFTVPNAPDNDPAYTFSGWQLLRVSDWVWYDGLSWVSNQGSSKLYLPGEVITFTPQMINPKSGDDSFYLCAVWNKASAPDILPITPSTKAEPSEYGWQWASKEAYGYIGNYSGNGQDIELSVDLCLLPSQNASSAVFYTNGTEKSITIDQNAVTLGSVCEPYTWGDLSTDNWHNVKFKILNNMAYVFIDGKLIAYDNGYIANEAYQLLFSLSGEMAIDNMVMMSSTGKVFFDCSFESESYANKLMGEGLGKRTLISSPAPELDVSISPSSNEITGKGSVTFTATPSEEGVYTYSWSSSEPSLLPYISGAETNELTVTIPENLSFDIAATLTCTVTDAHGKAVAETVSFCYIAVNEPEPEEPKTGDVNDDGKFNTLDINYVKRILNGSIAITEYHKKTADYNGDGNINAIDINLMIRFILFGT